jgi:hypothetical protein
MTEFVIDTVAFRCDWKITCLDSVDWNVERVYNEGVLQSGNSACSGLAKTKAYHKSLGIRVSGIGATITYVQANLARVLHGDNGRLIRSQEEIDAALDAVILAFGEFADTSSGIRDFVRVDLGLHFVCKPEQIIRAHRNCRYPRTSRPRIDFGEHSASWNYDGRRIIMYDKGREMTRRYMQNDGLPSDLLRVEIQLQKAPLKNELGGGEYPEILIFSECYEAFRRMMLKFAPPMEIPVPKDMYSAVAVMEQAGSIFQGQTALELITSSMPDRTVREWKRKVSQANLQMLQFDWAEKLPEQVPPPFIDWQ